MRTRGQSEGQVLLLALALGFAGCAARAPVAPSLSPSIGDHDVMIAIRVLPSTPADRKATTEPTSPSDADRKAATEPTSPSDDGTASASGRSARGDAYARSGYLSAAIAEYAKAAALDPDNAMHHFKLGLTYQASYRYAEALDAYQKASRLEPASAWPHAAVSIVHAKMGNQDAALEEYKKVKRLDHEMAEGLLDVLGQYGSFHET